MHIAIDAHMLGTQEGGNETYISGLISGLSQIYTPGNTITAMLSQEFTQHNPIPLHTQPVVFKNQGNFQRLFKEIPQLCSQIEAEVLHATYNISPFIKCPTVLAVHDIIFHRYPHYFSPRVRLLLNTLLPLSMLRATEIVTISEASKDDIVQRYPFTSEKISVTYLAAGPLVEAVPDFEASAAISQQAPFVLAVGTVQPRKNIARLVQAFIAFKANQNTNTKLVIVGKSSWQGSEIQRITEGSPYKNDIVFTGYLPDSIVVALFKTCRCFAYPSLYEGFGLPVLEAMACGAPVITSNISSLPEVAGQSAILVDPTSIEEIASAIQMLCTKPELRFELIQKGQQQAALFSWKATAEQTMSIYERVVQSQQRNKNKHQR